MWVWYGLSAGGAFRLLRIYLPVPEAAMADIVKKDYPDAVAKTSPDAERMARELQRLMRGERVTTLGLEILDLDSCTPFQRTVLAGCFQIPRGRVSSYGALARVAGVSQGARAVGMVMAVNPFPLIIPCHRVVRSDGALGGFGGGLPLKKALLAGEGVVLDKRDKVVAECRIEKKDL